MLKTPFGIFEPTIPQEPHFNLTWSKTTITLSCRILQRIVQISQFKRFLESINRFPLKKEAPEPDQILNKALKNASRKTIFHLTKIFSCCISFEHFPMQWKVATVVMVPKLGKNRLIPTNYRPISL